MRNHPHPPHARDSVLQEGRRVAHLARRLLQNSPAPEGHATLLARMDDLTRNRDTLLALRDDLGARISAQDKRARALKAYQAASHEQKKGDEDAD